MGAFLRRGMLDVVMCAKEMNASAELNRKLEAEITRLREKVGRLMDYEEKLVALVRSAKDLDAEALISRARMHLHEDDLEPDPVATL